MGQVRVRCKSFAIIKRVTSIYINKSIIPNVDNDNFSSLIDITRNKQNIKLVRNYYYREIKLLFKKSSLGSKFNLNLCILILV